MESQWIIERTGDDAPTVVFVHGIMSDSGTCWKHAQTGTYWPRLVADELTGAGVYVFSYYSRFCGGRFSVMDAANSLWDALIEEGILQSRVIILVCHSMGGIVARRLLVQHQRALAEKRAVVGLFLVASPSAGSSWANFLYPLINFFRHSQAQILKAGEDNQWLTTLGTDFRDLLAEPTPMIRGQELVEERPVYLLRYLPWIKPVVAQDEGVRYFPNARRIAQSDHFSIAKPANANAHQHELLRRFADGLEAAAFSISVHLLAGMTFKQAIGSLAQIEAVEARYLGLSDAQLNTRIQADREARGGDAVAVAERMIALYFGNEPSKFTVAVRDGTITVEVTP
ncbi:MAG: alpha/beta fold hydrolase [Lysobacter sp.]|nr:alpha/beta fold hydrolase [Lysobacter sp.]